MSVQATVDEFIKTGDFKNAVSCLHERELEMNGLNAEEYSLLMVLYLCDGDFESSKLCWKRIHDDVKTSSEGVLPAIWAIAVAVSQRNFAHAFAAMNFAWPQVFQSYVGVLATTMRNRLVRLISEAYSTISVSSFASTLGLAEQAAIEHANQLGWKIDNGFIFPVKQAPVKVQCTGLDNLNQLTEYVVHLEQQHAPITNSSAGKNKAPKDTDTPMTS